MLVGDNDRLDKLQIQQHNRLWKRSDNDGNRRGANAREWNIWENESNGIDRR